MKLKIEALLYWITYKFFDFFYWFDQLNNLQKVIVSLGVLLIPIRLSFKLTIYLLGIYNDPVTLSLLILLSLGELLFLIYFFVIRIIYIKYKYSELRGNWTGEIWYSALVIEPCEEFTVCLVCIGTGEIPIIFSSSVLREHGLVKVGDRFEWLPTEDGHISKDNIKPIKEEDHFPSHKELNERYDRIRKLGTRKR